MPDSHESKVGNGKLHRENVYQRFYITINNQKTAKGFPKNTLKMLRCYLRSKDYRLIDYTQFEQKYVSERKIFVKTRDYV